MSFPNIANVGHHEFQFPTYVKPGKDYQFMISDSKNKEEQVITKPFGIKRKIPLLLKAIPVAIVGIIIYVIVTKKSPAADEPIVDPLIPN
jgi:hypothetical protein